MSLAHIIPVGFVGTDRKQGVVGDVIDSQLYQTDTFTALLAFAQLPKTGLHFEPNSGRITLEPVLRPRTLTSVAVGGSHGGTPDGAWEDIVDRVTGVTAANQYDGTANRQWYYKTASNFLAAGASFALKLSSGAAHADGDHSADGTYRRIVFPTGAAAGETVYRLTDAYGESCKLEYSIDAEATWEDLDIISSVVDSSESRFQGESEVTYTFWQLQGGLAVWCGGDLTRPSSFMQTDLAKTNAGGFRVEGKNGTCKIEFSDLHFKVGGYYDSADKRAPGSMSRTPDFIFSGNTPSGASVVGSVVSRDAAANSYVYRTTMTGVPIGGAESFSAVTPEIDHVTIMWPAIEQQPAVLFLTEEPGVIQIEEDHAFSFDTGIYSYGFDVTLDNTFAQRSSQQGLNATLIKMGYPHTGLFSRNIGLGNVDGEHLSDGAESTYRANVTDLWFMIERGILEEDLYPSRWCVYSVVRFLLSQAQLPSSCFPYVPDCAFGPDPPNCTHTKYGYHPGFHAGTRVVDALANAREIEGAWMGPQPGDYGGQKGGAIFRFEPFDYTGSTPPTFSYYGSPTGEEGGDYNGTFKAFRRVRSLRKVRTSILLAGFEQSTGRPFAYKAENAVTLAGRYNPYAPNYIGFSAPLLYLWSGFATVPFTAATGDKMLRYFPYAEEQVMFEVPGQPNLFPMQIIYAQEPRVLPRGATYWVTRVQSFFRSPDEYRSIITATWTRTGNAPGT